MSTILYAKEAYEIVGACMEVHNELGPGLLEVVYKDALEYEFEERKLSYEREKQYPIYYKGRLMRRLYKADFVALNKIILEVKCKPALVPVDIAYAINYGKISKCKLVLLINFGKVSLEVKRIII